jgi:hypothetical protein
MTADQITSHLEQFRERQERIASEERAKQEKEEALFLAACESCGKTMRTVVEPILEKLSASLTGYGHGNLIHPTQEIEQITERTKLRTVEYATALAVRREKGEMILRIVASPRTMRISSTIGVPHGNFSSVFHAGEGPLSDAEEVTNRGIADFLSAAFPLR